MSAEKDATARLEALWSGEFGDHYVERNSAAAAGRREFWAERLGPIEVTSALEVGCNVGGNIAWLAELLGAANVAGVDVNEAALERARAVAPGADLRIASAYELPWDDGTFDLAFTTGVLIHLPPEHVAEAMAEIVRCSRRYVLCGEYHASELEEVVYRGEEGALFKRDYGRLYRENHPELSLIDTGFLPASEGVWDDVTWWLFEKT